MTVYELIQKAAQLPPDAPVKVSEDVDDQSFTLPVRAVYCGSAGLVIVIDSVETSKDEEVNA